MNAIQRIVLVLFLTLLFVPRALSQTQDGVKPHGGFVPDQVTAIHIAEAVLVPIYGKEQVGSERPFTAKLDGSTWIVSGYIPQGVDGGVAEVWIDKRDGRILRVSHGK